MRQDQNTGPAQLRICAFRGLQNLPLYVAIRQGFFAAYGLDVGVLYTSGSAAQITGLARGEYELIQTAPDNVISAASTPAVFGLDGATRVVMVLGGSVGPLSVYAQRHISAPGDLRGAVLGVDNPHSGFALVLRDMLAHHDLRLGRDYTFTVAGGTSARLNALINGEVAATILYAPYDALAEAAGLRRLATSTAFYSAYASHATAGLREWIAGHPDTVTRYISGVLRALHWIYDAANAADARSMLRDEPELGLDAGAAAQAYAAFVAPGAGFGSDAQLDDAGLEQVIALRAAYGTPVESLGHAADYYDRRWYDRARVPGAAPHIQDDFTPAAPVIEPPR
ncbi:MAG TPA: ABC transporter substrate-binding protein [Ktedonobacterales bacterium]|nr:ABC transporter substrate-binding protein [Ktedonobacterales bacterium]